MILIILVKHKKGKNQIEKNKKKKQRKKHENLPGTVGPDPRSVP